MALRVAWGLLTLASAVVAEDLHFLVMGDWGGTDHSPWTHTAEVNTAKQMDKAAADLGAKFTLALGDNFYYHGVEDVDDTRFQDTFEKCFNGDSLKNDHTFHVIAGNHDHYGNVQAQIDYSSKSTRWSFPSLYYTFSKTAPDGATVQFVMIDTVGIAGQSQLNAEDVGGLKGTELPGPANLTAAESQLYWIDKTLAASTADFVIVAGHYPVYSVGDHGPTSALSPKNFPYLQQHKVSAYLCGHDHSEQHIDKGDGVQYHVIGNANFHSGFDHTSTVSSSQLKYHDNQGSGGYATFSVNKDGMVIKHYDGDGTLAYTAPSIPPRGSLPPSPPPTPHPTSAYDCRTDKKADNIGTDTNLQHTGDDRSTCTSACDENSDCQAVYWHKTDNHCHILTGSFNKDEWEDQLASNDDYDSCFKTSGSEGMFV